MASQTHPKDTAITVWIGRDESDQLDRLASRERESRSVVVRRLIRKGLALERRTADPQEAA
jgi:predicted transcriptional regulator